MYNKWPVLGSWLNGQGLEYLGGSPMNNSLGLCFGKRVCLRKWVGTVADLIDVRKRKKVRMFCIKK
jgi:hypothetical protein